ncbi:hypothetical protein ACRS6B_01365 [Nocardia asteroides]
MTAHPNRARDRRWSRSGSALTAFAAGTAALVLVAPAAGAAVTTATATAKGMTFGFEDYGTNCEYRVTATVDNASSSDSVQFTDSAAGTFQPNPAPVVGNQATTVWVPDDSGPHTISATQGAGPAWTSPVMTVGNGMNLGGACVVLP